jgi:hypothetical protein
MIARLLHLYNGLLHFFSCVKSEKRRRRRLHNLEHSFFAAAAAAVMCLNARWNKMSLPMYVSYAFHFR